MVKNQPDLRSIIVRSIAIELDVGEDAVMRARSLRADLAMDSVAAANVLFCGGGGMWS